MRRRAVDEVKPASANERRANQPKPGKKPKVSSTSTADGNVDVAAAALIRRSVTGLVTRSSFGEITEGTLATLRAECPGWDYQALHAEFRAWVEADPARTPVSYQKAFIGFVRRFDKANRYTLGR